MTSEALSGTSAETLSQLALQGDQYLHSLIDNSFRLFKALKDASSPKLIQRESNENILLSIQESKNKYLQDAKELKTITLQIRKTMENIPSVSPHLNTADEALVTRRDELQKMVFQKTEILKALIDRLRQLQFNMSTMFPSAQEGK